MSRHFFMEISRATDINFTKLYMNSRAIIVDLYGWGYYDKGINEQGGGSMQYDAKAMNRLKRIEGQLRGVLRMMEEGKDCKEVITQLSAIRSGVDRTIGVIVTDNLLECIRENEGDDDKMNEVVQEAITLVVKSR